MAKHLESSLQESIVKWFKYQHPMFLLIAIPNGAYTGHKNAITLLKEGLFKGASDLILLYGNKKYNGLCIEVKTLKGVQSDSQKRFESKCKMFNYKYIIVRSLEEFIKEINNYIYEK